MDILTFAGGVLVSTATVPDPVIIWSPSKFIGAFRAVDYAAIRSSADALVLQLLDRARFARDLRSDDPDVLAGLSLLVAKSLISSDERTRILAGLPPDNS